MMKPIGRRIAPFVFLAVLAPLPVAAQLGDPVTNWAVAAGDARSDSLPSGMTHSYSLELGAGYFVLGQVDQRTVDVTIEVHGPDDKVVERFDRRRRGAEKFAFEVETAGTYRVELSPEGDSTGTYRLRVDRVEPVATDPAERVGQLMAPFAGDEPGGVVGVVREGELVFARGYGMANLTHDVPFTAETRTNIGSTTKQFTAFAIGLLAGRGLVSLDDDVRKHIPELPDFGSTVTLRHLLTHTSGYREFLNTLVLTGRRIDLGDHIDRDELIEIVQRQPALQNEPGAEWNYNNTGYGLLAEVVARVTETPFPQWMEDNVFEPLGMRNTVVRESPADIVENSARGYVPAADGGFHEAPDLAGAMGAGGIYTTVGDLALWIENLETGRLGGKALVEAMTRPYVLTTGDTTTYGLGLSIDEYRGARRIHHGGADIAHRSMLAYYPETATGVVVLSNFAAFPGSIHGSVVDAFLGDALEPGGEGAEETAAAAVPDAPFDPASYDLETFDRLAGRYALDEAPAFILSFFREGDSLFAQATGQPRVGLTPTSDTTFTLVGVPASLTFHSDDSGAFTHLTLHQNGDHRATRLEAGLWTPSESELEAFTGRFYSEELETYYTLALEEGRLVVRHRRFDDVELRPDTVDRFTGSFPIASIEFDRDDSGRVPAFTVENTRARDIHFERVR